VCFRLNLKLRALEMLHQASRTLCRDAASLKKKKKKKKTFIKRIVLHLKKKKKKKNSVNSVEWLCLYQHEK